MTCFNCKTEDEMHTVFGFGLCDVCYIQLWSAPYPNAKEKEDWVSLGECFNKAGQKFPFQVLWRRSVATGTVIKIVKKSGGSWVGEDGYEYLGVFDDWKLASETTKRPTACTCLISDLMTQGCKCGYLIK